MDLSHEVPDYGEATVAPSKEPKKMKKVYPSVTIEKDTGRTYKYNEEFTAEVRFRVKNIEDGESYEGQKRKHRCTLELLDMTPIKREKKGLPS